MYLTFRCCIGSRIPAHELNMVSIWLKGVLLLTFYRYLFSRPVLSVPLSEYGYFALQAKSGSLRDSLLCHLQVSGRVACAYYSKAVCGKMQAVKKGRYTV